MIDTFIFIMWLCALSLVVLFLLIVAQDVTIKDLKKENKRLRKELKQFKQRENR